MLSCSSQTRSPSIKKFDPLGLEALECTKIATVERENELYIFEISH